MAVQAQRFLNSRARLLIFGLLLIAAVYLLAVTPMRTYLDQRQRMEATSERLAVLDLANERLRQRAVELQSDAEIARLAREKYELVPEGTEAYAVMPPPPAPAPPAKDEKKDGGLWDRVVDGVSFWN